MRKWCKEDQHQGDTGLGVTSCFARRVQQAHRYGCNRAEIGLTMAKEHSGAACCCWHHGPVTMMHMSTQAQHLSSAQNIPQSCICLKILLQSLAIWQKTKCSLAHGILQLPCAFASVSVSCCLAAKHMLWHMAVTVSRGLPVRCQHL